MPSPHRRPDPPGGPVAEVVLEIPARPEYLHLARQVISAAAELEPTFADDRIADLRLAVSEATTNAIEAHLDRDRDERVLLRCDLGEEGIEVEVLDRGGGFDDEEGRGGRAAEWDEGGYGLPLMRRLTDETHITSSDGGTSVRLTVFVPDRFRG